MSGSLLLQHRSLFVCSGSYWEQVSADTLFSATVLVIPAPPELCQGQWEGRAVCGGAASRPNRCVLSSYTGHREFLNLSSGHSRIYLQVRQGCCWWLFLQDKAVLLLAKPSPLLWSLGPLMS